MQRPPLSSPFRLSPVPPAGCPTPIGTLRRGLALTAATIALAGVGFAQAQDIRIAHISDQTGPLEAYAKQTQIGLMLGRDLPDEQRAIGLTAGDLAPERPSLRP